MNITPKQRTLAITMLIAVVLLGWLLWPSQPPKAMLTAQVTREDIDQTVLAKACQSARIPFDNKEAHSALYDTERTTDLFCHIVNRWKSMGGWPPVGPDSDSTSGDEDLE